MFIPEQPQFYESKLSGYLPVFWSGNIALDGAVRPWDFAPIGSVYVLSTDGTIYKKTADTDDTSDWETVGSGVTDHGALTGLADDDHTQYLLATGARTGASSTIQTLTNGVKTGVIQAIADGTASIVAQNAAGTADVWVADTTNNIFTAARGTSVLNFFVSGGGNTTATGTYNVCMGTGAGSALSTGSYNNCAGINAGQDLSTGSYNNNYGINAGDNVSTGSYNNSFGFQAGRGSDASSASFNNNFGYRAGNFMTTGQGNNNFAREAGYNLTSGLYNNNFGYLSGFTMTTGNYNNNIGMKAGYLNLSGDYNVNIGFEAGYTASTITGNICIGFRAGYAETTAGRLHIGNTLGKSLLLGDFTNNKLAIGGQALETPTTALDVIDKDATTNAVVNAFRIRKQSSGTPAAGFGAAISSQLQSSTTAAQDAGRISWSWITATHASRASRADFTTYYTSTERTSLSIGSNATVPLLSFYGATPAAKPAITGSRGGNAALASLLTQLATLGLITDSTSA